MHINKSIFVKAIITMLMFAPMLLPVSVGAQFNPLEKTCEQAPESEVCVEIVKDEDPLTGTAGVLEKVSGVLAFVSAVIAVIIIVIAGITMILSGGDPGKVKSSRDAIIYALVGVVIILISRSIVLFVINRIG